MSIAPTSPDSYKTVIVASHNPVKLSAARHGFERMFPGETFQFQPIAVPSGVSDQPFSDHETQRGALQRAQAAREQTPQADYWVGIEGGVSAEGGDILHAFAWIAVLSTTHTGLARTGILQLPPQVVELVRAGKELGEADDIVFGRSNSKQQDGAVGILTGGALDRAGFYEQAVILALIPLKNEALYNQ
jgi:inosine/xanthosine triphosphatase